jgi:hypothetical protein
MPQSPVVALVVTLACSHPYLALGGVLYWIYRNSLPKAST